LSVTEDRDGLRAADVDREFVAERLRDALNEGRLTLTEYDDRIKDAYAARTYGDLKGLLSDLPAPAPASGSQVAPAGSTLPSMGTAAQARPAGPPRGTTGQWVMSELGQWLTLSIIVTAIWLISGTDHYFWPVWVIGPIGVIKLIHVVNGLASGEPRKQWERQQRKAVERERRREQERNRLADGGAAQMRNTDSDRDGDDRDWSGYDRVRDRQRDRDRRRQNRHRGRYATDDDD
jgi:hypothetical protein